MRPLDVPPSGHRHGATLGPEDYALFSDESRHTEGRFRSIAAVSLPAGSVVALSNTLSEVLECSLKGEFKWSKVGRRGKKNVQRAIAGVDFLLSHVPQGIRVRVLTWDTEDARHDVDHRDDVGNFARMSYHLYRSAMLWRGPGLRWHVRRDRLGSDGETIRDCLNSEGAWKDRAQLDLPNGLSPHIPQVDTWREVDSAATPFVQLADLMAGMAAYTRTKAQVVHAVLKESAAQGTLFPAAPSDGPEPTDRDRGRFRVIAHFYEQCRAGGLGVSLRTEGYLRTPSPEGPVNFWHYEPQGPWDTAPVKGLNHFSEALL